MTDTEIVKTTPEAEDMAKVQDEAVRKAAEAGEFAALAKQNADAALAEAVAAQAIADQLAAALLPTPDPSLHVLVDPNGHGTYTLVDPVKEGIEITRGEKGYIRSRTIVYRGRHCEHVETDPNGVWCYRGM